jgi:enterochelin esterase family protein
MEFFGAILRVSIVFSALCLCVSAQPLPSPVRSPEVSPDHRVTFRFRSPTAKQVFVFHEDGKRSPTQRGENDLWTVTTDPLEPNYYLYAFLVDGVMLPDPANSNVVGNPLFLSSILHVPGPLSLPWESAGAPRGSIHREFYRSELVGEDREYVVYTPAAYDARASRKYPVLYLLHPLGGNAQTWVDVGKAHVVFDNLIAQGKARPMVVVMPLGYGGRELPSPQSDGAVWQRNSDGFRETLLREIVPRVEKQFRVATDAS